MRNEEERRPPDSQGSPEAGDGRDKASEPLPGRRRGGFGATVKAVFWSFFGVRKRSDYESDAANLNPVHVLVAGVIGALLFIAVLVVIVRLVVAK